jgi:spermidine/putrescine transport system substrate-binding protein
MYRKDLVKNFEPSWDMIFNPAKQAGSFVLIDSVREMMGTGLLYQGKGVNTTSKDDLKAVIDLLIKAKKSDKFLAFEGGVGGKNKVAAGTATMAVVYNGDAVRAMADAKNLGFVNPKEGAVMWVDSMAITAKAPHPDAAMKFINYILDAKVGAQLSNFNHYASPNKASLPFVLKVDLNNPAVYPTTAEMKRMQFVNDVGKNAPLYDEAWTMIKTR